MRIGSKQSLSGTQLRSRLSWQVVRASITALLIGVLALVAVVPGVQAKRKAAPGDWTQADIDHSIVIAVAYIDTLQNPNCSYGTDYPETETGMALLAYSVLANGNFNNLSVSYQNHIKCALNWLLPLQDATGWWADFGYETYTTGLDLAGLSWLQGVDPRVPGAIAMGRNFLHDEFQGPAYTGCSSADNSPSAYYCGG